MNQQQTSNERINNLTLMLQHSGQDELILAAVRGGEKLEKVTAELADIWNCDAEELYHAATNALPELEGENQRIENSIEELR